MTLLKAKMYRTAQIAADAANIPEGFSAGQFVAVRYVNRGAFGFNFQVSATSTFELSAVMSENDLERFVL